MTSKRIFFTTFNTTVTSEVYKGFIDQLAETLTEEEIAKGWFQQDNAPAHTSKSSLKHLNDYFGDRVISKGLWPPRSPDLSPPDFFLWGYLKDKVFQSAPQNLHQLVNNIAHEIHSITQDTLLRVSMSVLHRANMCCSVQGDHFQYQV
jgi:hypothetical protein